MIVDASALTALFLKETGWEKIAALMAEQEASSAEYALKEILNAAWKRLRRGEMERKHIEIVYEALVKAVDSRIILIQPQKEILRRSLEISLLANVTIYDAVYIALAEKLKQPLLTLDTVQAQAAEEMRIPLVSL